MKKPVVNYSSFRLKKINEPEYSHLKLLAGWPVFVSLFILTEKLIPIDYCTEIYCALDEIIPFCELFVIPYILWYGLIVFSLGYFLLYDIEKFKKLQWKMIFVQIIAMLIYIIFPNKQDLRPKQFPRENFLTDIVALLYSVDTNTGVCPSLHCAISILIASAWLNKRDACIWLKIFISLLCLLICASTMFIKQHSFLDFVAALPLFAIAETLYSMTHKKEYFN